MVEEDQLGWNGALGVNVDASGLNLEVLLVSLEDSGAVLSSGKKSASLESSATLGSTSSCSGSASTRPSRIALATPMPLITATPERLYRLASTML